MNTSSKSPLLRPIAVGMLAAASVALLVACQTPRVDGATADRVTIHGPVAAIPAELRSLPADRLEAELARIHDEREALVDRFRGVPVDRIVEQLEREADE